MPRSTARSNSETEKHPPSQAQMDLSTKVATVSSQEEGPWNGRLVARVLPSSVDAEYDTKKPACQIDPSELCPGSGPTQCRPWRRSNRNSSTDDEAEKADDYEFSWNNKKGAHTSRVVLDLYLHNHRGREKDVIQLHMSRSSTEDMDQMLKRLELSIAKKIMTIIPANGKKKFSKKKRRSMASYKTSSSVWIKSQHSRDDDGPSNGDSPLFLKGYNPWNVSGRTNASVWQQIATDSSQVAISVSLSNHHAGGVLTIPIQVESCPPTLLAVRTFEQFEAHVFVGVPLVIETDLLFATRAIVNWFVDGVNVCHDSPCYTPVEADIGKDIAVWIVPIRPGHNGEGCEEAYRFTKRVEPLPLMPVVRPLREEWTRRRRCEEESSSSPTTVIRVLTYNLLADQNAYSRDAKNIPDLYPYCELQYLDRSRRMPMLLYEILVYQADIICLQEVDMFVYESLLKPVLEVKGYQGFYSVKNVPSSHEGCAMFWSLTCFERASSSEKEMQTHVIRNLFPNKEQKHDNDYYSGDDGKDEDVVWDSMNAIADLLQEYDELRHLIRTKLGHVLQVAVLRLKKTKKKHGEAEQSNNLSHGPDKIVLANTHLFFHPLAGHVRLMQLLVSCHELDKQRRSMQDGEKSPYPLIFCGDFNSSQRSGGVQLLFRRTVLPTHSHTWKHLNSFTWGQQVKHGSRRSGSRAGGGVSGAGDDTQQTKAVVVHHPPTICLPDSFPTLISGYGEMPKFTHYIQGFVGTLDYILASEPSETEPFGFATKQWAPMPSEEEVTRHYVAMPNEVMPSDHLSLVCDLEIIKT